MYYMDAEGKRVYTLKKETPAGEVTYSAHPGTSWGGCGCGCVNLGHAQTWPCPIFGSLLWWWKRRSA